MAADRQALPGAGVILCEPSTGRVLVVAPGGRTLELQAAASAAGGAAGVWRRRVPSVSEAIGFEPAGAKSDLKLT